MNTNFIFMIGLAFILTHEMDAIKNQEWAVFPLISRLESRTGYRLFTILHVPLFVLILWGLYAPNSIQPQVATGLNIFFIIHVGLHLLYLRHPQNQFKTLFSWALIFGAGICGFLALIL